MIHGSPQWRDNTQGMLSLTGVGKDTLLLQALVIQKRMETTFTEFLVQIKWDDLRKALGTVPDT